MGGAFRLEWALPYLAMVAGQDARSVDWNKVLAHRPLDTADSLLEAPIPEYRDWLAHPTYDEYWQRAFLREEDFAGIDIPFMTVTGWFDEDMPGTLRYWRATQQGGSSNGSLIIGPWNHMQTYLGGEPKLELLSFSEDAVLDLQAERLAFFDRCLKGKPGTPPPRVRAYLTGSNQWRTFDQYPPGRCNVFLSICAAMGMPIRGQAMERCRSRPRGMSPAIRSYSIRDDRCRTSAAQWMWAPTKSARTCWCIPARFCVSR
jgi:Predicted acyl esterases